MISQQIHKNSGPDLQFPQHHGKTFSGADFAAPIPLTLQSTVQLVTAAVMHMPTTAASDILLQNMHATDDCVFLLGLGQDLPVTITVPAKQSIQRRGSWSSIQSATGGTPSASVFWSY